MSAPVYYASAYYALSDFMLSSTQSNSKNDFISRRLGEYQNRIRETITTLMAGLPMPPELYDPFRYAMEQPGKYMRPLMTMLGSALHDEPSDEALYAGVAVEIMHTFTLVHDDIMDKSPLRRGRASVHTKWDESTAILSGDAMMGVAYKLLLEHTHSQSVVEVLRVFTQGFIEVCEGQALDVAYATRPAITMEEYLCMIEKKTARLPETAAVIGALLAGADDEQCTALRTYAREAGIAFQIQDDLLDVVADQAELGKKIGQDLLEGKRTYLIVRSLEVAQKTEHIDMLQAYVRNRGISESEVPGFTDMMRELGVFADATKAIEQGFAASEMALEHISASSIARQGFTLLNQQLRGRRK